MHDILNHEHSHEHHHHTHEGITAFDSKEQAVSILTYMLEHNVSHAEELHEICHKLEASGEEEAAKLIDEAVDAFREGNSMMETALNVLKKEK
ncbi:MAG: cobalt transporter [Lachnospiraceae bacterium]|nr:cobalt transporter [Lachnospiraceae bacterium]MBR6349995.1 cobalt transporter [Lachnospiraceae bacterium]